MQRERAIDAYTLTDRRRARFALVLLVLALCEGASAPPETNARPSTHASAAGSDVQTAISSPGRGSIASTP